MRQVLPKELRQPSSNSKPYKRWRMCSPARYFRPGMPARSAMSALVDGPIAIRLAADGQIDSRPRCFLTCGRAHPLAGALTGLH